MLSQYDTLVLKKQDKYTIIGYIFHNWSLKYLFITKICFQLESYRYLSRNYFFYLKACKAEKYNSYLNQITVMFNILINFSYKLNKFKIVLNYNEIKRY